MPPHCAAIKDSSSKGRFTAPNKCSHTETHVLKIFKVTSKNGIIKSKASLYIYLRMVEIINPPT